MNIDQTARATPLLSLKMRNKNWQVPYYQIFKFPVNLESLRRSLVCLRKSYFLFKFEMESKRFHNVEIPQKDRKEMYFLYQNNTYTNRQKIKEKWGIFRR